MTSVKPRIRAGQGAILSNTGLMIIRAWVEPGSTDPLRAQLRITTDVANGIERTVTLSRAEAVSDTVQEWLADILAHAEPSVG